MVEFVDFTSLAIQLSVIVFLVEAVTETIKAVTKDKLQLGSKVIFYIALVVGIAAAILLKISLFNSSNLVIFYVGSILAGAIGSRGANHVHDILQMLSSLRRK